MMRRRTCALALVVGLALWAQPALAQRAWIKDEVRLNIRTGPGVQYRILGALKSGDEVGMLSRGEGWTQVRTSAGLEGWIPEGYLQTEPTAGIRLEGFESELADLRQRFERVSGEAEELKVRHEELSADSAAQQAEVQRLTRENLELRAGARWPEWIAGASILFVGAILGMIVHRSSTRRPGPRIRL
jgi:SH3 domain protein